MNKHCKQQHVWLDCGEDEITLRDLPINCISSYLHCPSHFCVNKQKGKKNQLSPYYHHTFIPHILSVFGKHVYSNPIHHHRNNNDTTKIPFTHPYKTFRLLFACFPYDQ